MGSEAQISKFERGNGGGRVSEVQA